MLRDNAEESVIIVGAGAAGLSTAAALAHRQIASIVLDRDDEIGGTWSRRYTSLKLHTVRRYSGLAHYPISEDRPKYLSKEDYAAYLKEYADVMGIHVLPSENVEAVREIPSSSGKMCWEVTTTRRTWRTKIVIVATGHYSEPYVPAWKNLEEFSGKRIHSSDYTTGADFIGQSTLVVGLGNSGAEIASDLSENGAARISVSVRTSPPIVTRELFQVIPVQLLGIALTPLGMPRIIDRIGAVLRRFAIGDLTAYGLASPSWGPFTSRKPAVIDTGFVKNLKQRRIRIRPPIATFDSRGVIYEDGTSEAIDVLIAATGFRTGIEKFLRVREVVDNTGQPRFRSGESTSAPGLYFIGFDETIRGHLFEIERDSKRLAVEVERYITGFN